jgi:hypothetical protein
MIRLAGMLRLTLSLGQEPGLFGEVLDHPERSDSAQDREEAFQDEDPSPSRLAGYAVHVLDCRGKKST